MRAEIHPNYRTINVSCSCGRQFEINSSTEKDSLNLDVCSHCHPFYTGTQKILDTKGRIDDFNRKFAGLNMVGRKKSQDKVEKDKN